MKLAFHFNSNHESLKGKNYSLPVLHQIFNFILSQRNINISSKIFMGDLLLMDAGSDVIRTEDGWIIKFNKEKYIQVINNWLNTGNHIWVKFTQEKINEAVRCNIFTVCFENIELSLAEDLHDNLVNFPSYLGALEVDDTSKLHWEIYTNSIGPKFRILNSNINVFWYGISEDDKDFGWIGILKQYGFEKVEFESLSGKYTIFDRFHNYKQARRVAEWRKQSGNLLAFVSDDVVCKLIDAAPLLGDKLWTAFKAFHESETDEQYAHVATSCRRIVEYVTDCLFPPTDQIINGREMTITKYKNRLLAFADKERRSDTNIDVIVASTNLLREQIEKLNKLTNKGVHAEVYREEARRCLIRTVLLLDDFISLKNEPLPIRNHFDG
ncbi:MAG TPA: hypothetical protein DEF34_02245 [Desulfotomaculum sp.]|nr:MAG: hypothetical protein JL56_03340 [Desulfotomaculum sp. BICA1-6]HBX22447.1 hypothetical protein [Desulfotomaculum sp.]